MSWRPCSFGSASPAPSLPLAVLRWGKCLCKPTQSLSGAQTYQNQKQKCQLGRAVNRISQGSPCREAAVSSVGSQHLNSELMCLESNVSTKAFIPDTVRDMPKCQLILVSWLFQSQQLSPIWRSQRTPLDTCPSAGLPRRVSSAGTTSFCTTQTRLFRKELRLTRWSRASLSRTCYKAECTNWWLLLTVGSCPMSPSYLAEQVRPEQ